MTHDQYDRRDPQQQFPTPDELGVTGGKPLA